MENMGADKWAKIPLMPQNLSAQVVCLSPKTWNFDEKDYIGRLLSAKAANTYYLPTYLKRYMQVILFQSI